MIQYEAAVIILFTVLLLIQSVTVNPFSTLAFSSRKFDSRPHLHQQGPTSTTRIHSDMNSHARHVTEIGKGPIFITIGPQGAGKTTFISNLSADVSADADTATTPHAVDICIDNQEGVYLPIPIDLFLVNSIENKTLATKHNALIQYSIHNNTIQERIYDAANDEMRWITQRLCNQITQQEFINKIMTMDTNNATQATWKNVLQRDGDADVDGESPDWKTYLLKIVDDNVLKEHDIHVDHVDLFVVESIFKQTPKNLPFASTNGGADDFAKTKTNIDWPSHITNRPKSGLLAVSSKLKFLAMDEIHQSTSLAWGNTNAKSRDYVTALEIAQESGRPVHFVPYANIHELDIECSTHKNNSTFHLPRIGIKALIERNILRFKNTGRFIPTKAIIDTCDRVDMLLLDAVEQMKKKSNFTENSSFTRTMNTKFDLDCALASMASFGMKANRTVYKLQIANFRGGRGRGRGRMGGGRVRSLRENDGRGGARGDNRNIGNKRNHNYDGRETRESRGGNNRNHTRFDSDERGESSGRNSTRYYRDGGSSH